MVDSRLEGLLVGHDIVVKPPSILVLQSLNALVGFCLYLSVSLGTQMWNADHWTAARIGLVMTMACLGYAGPVAVAGIMADRWGRAKTSFLGMSIALVALSFACARPSSSSAAVAVIATFVGSAFFFPGCAGLFSDAEGERAGSAPMPLHTKVSRYNLGWSSGNFSAFIFAFMIAGIPPAYGYAVGVVACLIVLAVLRPRLGMPATMPAQQGDRGSHPALGILIPMCRVVVLVASMMGMAFIALLERSLTARVGGSAHTLTCVALGCYAAGYISMFVLLGSWGGWTFRPWRPWLLQLGMLVGSAGVVVIGFTPSAPAIWIAACAAVMGIGYGAAYTGSIYYSMRLPDGAARAASFHEACLGIGNTISPLLAGLLIDALSVRLAPGADAAAAQLAALGVYCASCALAALLLQAVLIPRVMALGRSSTAVAAPATA